jgi:hypothetical protein
LHRILRDLGVPFDDAECALGDFVIRCLLVARVAHLDFLCDGADPFDPASGLLGGRLLHITRHMPGQCDNPVIHGDPDIGCIDAGIEVELIEDFLL